MPDHTTKLPPIPEPAPTIESIGLTVRALMHAMDIVALNASGAPNAQLFVRRGDYDQLHAEFRALRSEFAAYKASHP